MKRTTKYLGATLVLAIVVTFAVLSFGGLFSTPGQQGDTAVLWRNSIIAKPFEEVAVLWRNSIIGKPLEEVAVLWRNSIAPVDEEVAVLWRNSIIGGPLEEVAVLWRDAGRA